MKEIHVDKLLFNLFIYDLFNDAVMLLRLYSVRWQDEVSE
jgi:hypothetical protein